MENKYNIKSWSTGEWSEWHIDRYGPRYYLTHNSRVTGTRYPIYHISKAEALSLSSAADCERWAETHEPTRTVTCR